MFVPAVTSAASHGKLYAFSGQSLCVREGDRVLVPAAGVDPSWLALGVLDGEPCFACTVDEPLPGTKLVPLRALFGVLSEDEFGVAGRALGLTTWDRDHQHCGRCGAPTDRSRLERVRSCPRCGHGAYPRLSPAVIVLVERDGRVLLARNARTRAGFHSVLAGFVEVGESLEQAAAREVREEAGIQIGDLRYFGSQPWPLTGSLMVGFTAHWQAGELVAEPREICDAGWFAPDALPPIPGRLSIARALLDDFVVRRGGTPLP